MQAIPIAEDDVSHLADVCDECPYWFVVADSQHGLGGLGHPLALKVTGLSSSTELNSHIC